MKLNTSKYNKWYRIGKSRNYKRSGCMLWFIFVTFHGIYDSSCTINLTFYESLPLSLTTRGNSLKLLQHYCHYDLRRHNFTNRIVSVWNSLPNNVVTANMINTFKNRLDKFWEHQAVLYNYCTNITGIGNCSIVVG